MGNTVRCSEQTGSNFNDKILPSMTLVSEIRGRGVADKLQGEDSKKNGQSGPDIVKIVMCRAKIRRKDMEMKK